MGTDIQLFAEVKRDGAWHLIGGMEENPIYHPDEGFGSPLKPVELYTRRHYSLFAVLANVRNPPLSTLEGKSLGDEFGPISLPRGLPPDLSSELRDYYDFFGDAAFYAESWLMLSEVLRFDWHGKALNREAMVDVRAAHLFTDPNAPFPWEQWPKDVQAGYAGWLKDGVMVRWRETYAQAVGPDVMQLFESLQEHGKPSRVRLVFWFD